MAKAVVVANEQSTIEQWKAIPQRFGAFLGDVRGEMRKVVTPSRKEVESTTAVVLVCVFIFAAYFWAVDGLIGKSLEWLLHRLTGN